MVTKLRLIYGDVVLLIVLCALYFLTEHLTKNLLAMGLAVLVLVGRSTFLHVIWYKKTGKIY